MPLESGHKVTIWSIEDKGNYAKASLTGQKKDKDGNYVTDWSNPFCTLFGKAYEAVKNVSIDTENKEHISAKIGWGYDTTYEKDGKTYTRKQAPFSVTNNYDKVKGKQYTNYAIFDMTLSKSNKSDSYDDEEVEETPTETASGSNDVTQEQGTSQNGLVGLDFLNIPDSFGAELPFK